LNIRPHYKNTPNFKTRLIYLRSFLRVCNRVGFNSATGFYYWKMFFTVIFRNPKGIETAVNLAAMFIHFQKQKEYGISLMKHMIGELEKTGEKAYYAKMMENNQRPD
jgi:maltodextrin utilization protein YvdJ